MAAREFMQMNDADAFWELEGAPVGENICDFWNKQNQSWSDLDTEKCISWICSIYILLNWLLESTQSGMKSWMLCWAYCTNTGIEPRTWCTAWNYLNTDLVSWNYELLYATGVKTDIWWPRRDMNYARGLRLTRGMCIKHRNGMGNVNK